MLPNIPDLVQMCTDYQPEKWPTLVRLVSSIPQRLTSANALVPKDAVPQNHQHLRLQTSTVVVMHGIEQSQQNLQTWRSQKGSLAPQRHQNFTKTNSGLACAFDAGSAAAEAASSF